MASTTPFSRKIEGLRWLASLCAFWCAALLGSDEGVHVKSAEVSRNGDSYFLEANFAVKLTSTLEDALNKGLPLHFVTEFELIHPRWYTLYLWNKSVLEFEQRYRLSYNALTRQYRLSNGALHQNLDTMDEALKLIGQVRPRLLASADRLDDGKTYEAVIRLRLDVSHLPKPLQIDALASRDWNLASDWYRWTVTP